MLSFCKNTIGADHRGRGGGDDKHHHARAIDVDAVRLRRCLIVADRLQGKPIAGAKKEHDHADDGDGERKEYPVDQGLASAARACDRLDHGRRQTDTRAAADRRHELEDLQEDFGDHPGANGEISAAQLQQQQNDRNGDQRADDTGKRQTKHRIEASPKRAQIERIAAEPNEGLLTDRDQPGVAGQKIPETRQRHERVNFGGKTHHLAVAPIGQGNEHCCQHEPKCHADAARQGRMDDPRLRRRADILHAHTDTFGNSPCGRTISTSRKATWPAVNGRPTLI